MSETKTQKLCFTVEGAFITKLARDRFFYEAAPYAQVEKLLLSCMCGTDFDEETLKRMAQDVLLGRAEFVGNSGSGTFSWQETGKADSKAFERFSTLLSNLKETKAELQTSQQVWLDLAEVITEGKSVRDCEFESNRNLAHQDGLQSAIEEMLRYDKAEYGFISPDGEFTPVDYGSHHTFATEYIQKHKLEKDAIERKLDYLDYLIQHVGYILLHNPGMGKPLLTSYKPFTKRQRERLYQYYVEAGMDREANQLYEEGNE